MSVLCFPFPESAFKFWVFMWTISVRAQRLIAVKAKNSVTCWKIIINQPFIKHNPALINFKTVLPSSSVNMINAKKFYFNFITARTSTLYNSISIMQEYCKLIVSVSSVVCSRYFLCVSFIFCFRVLLLINACSFIGAFIASVAEVDFMNRRKVAAGQRLFYTAGFANSTIHLKPRCCV